MNIRFTADALLARGPHTAFGEGIRSVIAVASAARLRRVRQTLAQLLPDLTVIRQRPPLSFEREESIHRANGIDFIAHLAGELDRLLAYPKRGWIKPVVFPDRIADDHAQLLAWLQHR